MTDLVRFGATHPPYTANKYGDPQMRQLRVTLTLCICVLWALPLAAQMERPRSGGILYGPTTITEPGYYYATGDLKRDDVYITNILKCRPPRLLFRVPTLFYTTLARFLL